MPVVILQRNDAAGGGTDPSTLANLEANWQGDLGVTIGTGISSWASQGVSNTASQSTGSAQPTNPASVLNGYAVARFASASSQRFPTFTTRPLAQTNFTAFVVFKPSTLPGTMYLLSTIASGHEMLFLYVDSSGKAHVGIGDGAATLQATLTAAVSAGTFYTVTIEYDTTNLTIWLNGANNVSTANGGTVGARGTATGASIGSYAGGSLYLNGDIAACTIFTDAKNTTDRQNVELWYKTKYAHY
jgi:hypothetical protein